MTKQFFLFKQVTIWSVVALFCVALSPVAIAQHGQHETHTMPGMSKSQKPKAALKRNTKRKAKPKRSAKAKTSAKPAVRAAAGTGRRLNAFETIQRAKATASVHIHTPDMVMPPSPAAPASTSDSRRARSTRSKAAPPHKHTPGMAMPASSPPAKPKVSTSQHEMHMPQAAATPSPIEVSPHKHTPGMAMPASSPPANPPASTSQHEMHMPQAAATPSPSASPKPMDMQTPMSHPSPDPASQKHDSHDSMRHPAPGESKPADAMAGTHASGGHAMNTGSLLEMSGDEMSIRVGASEKNLMPMGQMASGTSWQPASTRMNMLHKASGEWLLMFHYNAVVGMNSQGGPRGVTKFESANWFMPMAFRKVGPGTLELRGMFSLEPFTFPPGGSPLLFQTGETYKGRPIIDAQHPHDLFMELSAAYTVPVGDRATWFAYFGYPGEPALGPTAFMHRASASENPAAALSHHLQDSSHISFGVLTTGFTYRWFKLEGSVFNGREPDENRYNFDAHRWNSRSARLSFAPNRNWSMQVSHGFLRDPEADEPGDLRRTTASISYNRPWKRGNWASSLIWGRNHEMHSGEVFKLNGYVAESTINFLDKNYLYTRLELVDKNALLRDVDRQLLGITDHHPSFRIGAFTFGGARDVWATKQLSMAIGGDVTFYSKPATLDPIYGANPTSYRLFLRFRPNKMDMGSMHGTH